MESERDYESVKFFGTLVSKIDAKLTIETIKTEKRIEVLIGKDKKFNLDVGSIYEFECGRKKGTNEPLWLNKRVKVVLLESWELGNIEIPKNAEDYKQFWLNVRSSQINAIELLKSTKEDFSPEDVSKVSEKLLQSLNRYFKRNEK